MKIIQTQDIKILRAFLGNAGESLKKFRYFNKRGFDVIKNHVVTLIGIENKEPIAYGHLDKYDGDIWLGICIAYKKLGCGYGKQMMSSLINEAINHDIMTIKLSVDSDNMKAIKLYEKFGFEFTHREERISYYEWRQ